MFYFLFVGLGAFVYGIRREKGRDRSVLAVAGILMAAVFAYLSYEFLASPRIWGGNPLAYGYIVVTFLAGVGIYFASRSYHKARGIDISLLFKEIPPE